MKKLYFLVVLFVVGSVNGQNPDDIVYIPDAVFKEILLNPALLACKDSNGFDIEIDVNNDSEIQVSEALMVYKMYASGYINSFEGIKSFKNLREFSGHGSVVELDFSGLIYLEELVCSSYPATSLNITGLANLKRLSLNESQITSLDLTGSPNIEHLWCFGNDLTFLDVSMLSNLKELKCYGNGLIELNTAGLTQLENLDCSFNNLSFLDIGGMNNMKLLKLNDNDLTSLNLAHMQDVEKIDVSYNSLNYLNVEGLVNLKELNAHFNSISSLNVQGMNNLEHLVLFDNEITEFDASGLTSLIRLSISSNDLTSLNLSGNTSLNYLSCDDNQLLSLDLTGLINLNELSCQNNQLTSLDLSGLINLYTLNCGGEQLTYLDVMSATMLKTLNVDNNHLEVLLMKNKMIEETTLESIFTENMRYICVEDWMVESAEQVLTVYGFDCAVNSYCSFSPAGESYIIQGNNTFDTNNNGCDVNDFSYPNMKFTVTDGIETVSNISNVSGAYLIPVRGGAHTVTPILENPTFFNISPTTVSVTFPATTSPFTQNFCITPNGLHPDLEVVILPKTPARPGFDAKYKILIKNKGNIQQSGSVSLAYNDAILDYEIATPVFTTQAEGLLSWAFANLEPFETREINVTLNVNSPMETPAVNGDDVLTYTATISSEATDDMPLDNTFSLPQIVVNSFDPNDKTCLEGTSISQSMIGQYVHYMIRFENTGTFAAENIVVKDMIDTAKFDVSSLVALNGSHPYVTRITGNKVEFIFENINLPFDDANNDGYVVFKIKTLPTLVLGNSFSNTASIYFDYNHPIITEPAVTTFADLDTKDFEFNHYLTIYPNPTSGILNITTKQAIEIQSISIYNVLGQMVVAVPNAKGVNNVDVSSLSTGNYFIKIVSDKGTSNSKFIKQ